MLASFLYWLFYMDTYDVLDVLDDGGALDVVTGEDVLHDDLFDLFG